jgi:pseudaminic acid synthase
LSATKLAALASRKSRPREASAASFVADSRLRIRVEPVACAHRTCSRIADPQADDAVERWAILRAVNRQIEIGGRRVGAGAPALIIAELSCDHLGDYDVAVETVQAMKQAGADCVKLQTLRPGSITIECDREEFIVGGGTLWDGKTLFDLYSEVYTPWEWHAPLKERIESLGMLFLSSPFDFEAVDFLDGLGAPAFKVASFEITDIPLVRHMASKGKPLIISTGIAHETDIANALAACRDAGNEDAILLKCTSSYPTPLEEVNLAVIPEMRERFDCLTGLSDHTEGSLVPIGAVALGARVIEKHFILDRGMGGPDAAFSMEPAEFAEMVQSVRAVESAIGSASLELGPKAEASRVFMRSLFVVEDLKAGDVLTRDNVRSIRPGHGMAPIRLDEVLGRKVARDVERGTPLDDSLLES